MERILRQLAKLLLLVVVLATTRVNSQLVVRLHSETQCPSPGVFRHVTECTKFYRCEKHPTGVLGQQAFIRAEFTCPAGTIFDETLTACNYLVFVRTMPPECNSLLIAHLQSLSPQALFQWNLQHQAHLGNLQWPYPFLPPNQHQVKVVHAADQTLQNLATVSTTVLNPGLNVTVTNASLPVTAVTAQNQWAFPYTTANGWVVPNQLQSYYSQLSPSYLWSSQYGYIPQNLTPQPKQ